jgi:DNA-binding transcriptional ArsR family regulator
MSETTATQLSKAGKELTVPRKRELTQAQLELNSFLSTTQNTPERYTPFLLKSNGKPDKKACMLLSDIISWHQPYFNYTPDGILVSKSSKIEFEHPYRSTKDLCALLNVSSRTLYSKVKLLEEHGLITKHLKHRVKLGSTWCNNVPFYELHVDTLKYTLARHPLKIRVSMEDRKLLVRSESRKNKSKTSKEDSARIKELESQLKESKQQVTELTSTVNSLNNCVSKLSTALLGYDLTTEEPNKKTLAYEWKEPEEVAGVEPLGSGELEYSEMSEHYVLEKVNKEAREELEMYYMVVSESPEKVEEVFEALGDRPLCEADIDYGKYQHNFNDRYKFELCRMLVILDEYSRCPFSMSEILSMLIDSVRNPNELTGRYTTNPGKFLEWRPSRQGKNNDYGFQKYYQSLLRVYDAYFNKDLTDEVFARDIPWEMKTYMYYNAGDIFRINTLAALMG